MHECIFPSPSGVWTQWQTEEEEEYNAVVSWEIYIFKGVLVIIYK